MGTSMQMHAATGPATNRDTANATTKRWKRSLRICWMVRGMAPTNQRVHHP